VSKSITIDAAPLVERLGVDAANEFQQECLNRLLSSGFPTTKIEEWKYTRIDGLLETPFSISAPVECKVPVIEGTYPLVFINGKFSAEQSATDIKGVEINCATEAGEKLLSKASDSSADAFANLNGAALSGGAYIKVTRNAAVDKPIHIINISTQDNGYSNIRHVIELESGAEAEILEDYLTSEGITALSNAVTDIHVAKNATLRHVKNQSQNNSSYHIGAIYVSQERDSSYHSTVLACGSKLSRNFLSTELNDENASVEMKGLYAVKGSQLTDNHTQINHNSARTFSDQLYKGILDDRSRGVFNGKVFIARDAQQVDSSQLNKNLMLSNKARVDTKPELDVYADDVKAAHGAAIGQLNDDELFYIQSRCISKDAAMAMLVHGHMEEIIETVKSESLRSYLGNIYLSLFD
jgi:Fe-S cluster assembly protein SufD